MIIFLDMGLNKILLNSSCVNFCFWTGWSNMDQIIPVPKTVQNIRNNSSQDIGDQATKESGRWEIGNKWGEPYDCPSLLCIQQGWRIQAETRSFPVEEMELGVQNPKQLEFMRQSTREERAAWRKFWRPAENSQQCPTWILSRLVISAHM